MRKDGAALVREARSRRRLALLLDARLLSGGSLGLVSSHVSDEDQIGVTELQMSNPERDAIRALAPATELVSFDVAAHDALVREATRLGITAEEYIHDAAVAQVALARQARGEDADGL